jgi:hypothetical protein
MTITAHHIASDINFAKIDQLLNKFNIFHATGMNAQEIKHTKFLAYLLDPNESHGLGVKFLTNFLRNIAQQPNCKNIEILNLNLPLALIITEKKLGNFGSIDMLIKIPKINNENNKKYCLLAIENKINAKQSINQLSNYKKALNSNEYGDADMFPLFLTRWGEEPNDEAWSGITYQDVIVPIIENLLEHSSEVISDYLCSILKDYLELITEEDESNSNIDGLVENIDKGMIEYIKQARKNQSNSLQDNNLFITYPRAIGFLEKYDTDSRSVILQSYKAIFTNGIWLRGGSKDITFHYETSSRKYLHCSFLDKDIAAVFSDQICSHPTRNWLASKRNLAFEVLLSTRESPVASVDGQFKLVLGPTNSEFMFRDELINALQAACDSSFPLSTPKSQHWTRIKSPKLKELQFENFKNEQISNWITDVFNKLIVDGTIANINNKLRTFLHTKELL